jgi:23S rRNA (uracil1939-C5)-methyltransferase
MDSLSTDFSTICPLFQQKQCCMMEDSFDAISSIKNFLLKEKIDLSFDFEKANPIGFRKKVKLAIRGTFENPQVGIFQKGTHDVIDLENCCVHDPFINAFISQVKKAIKTLQIAPYCEKSFKGKIRYIQVLINENNNLQAVLVLNERIDKKNELIEFLCQDKNLVSLYFNYQTKNTNTIFGEEFELVFGEKFLKFSVLEKVFYLHPGSFCQSNLLFFSKILTEIKRHLKNYDKGLDLYAGCGLFGLSFAEHFLHLGFCETNPYSKLSFDACLKKSDYEYITEDALDYLKKHLDADCVFIDPPRKGLAKPIKPLLAQLKKGAKLVYVSCGYESLIRDLKELIDHGFKIEKIKGFDCFVGSKEIETLVILEKV